jgi:hypothetical protein
MENSNVNYPFRIVESKHKRYASYYQIPASEAVVIPRKAYGSQYLCDALWKDENGVIKIKTALMFDSANLVKLNPMKDYTLYTIWELYLKPQDFQTA